MCQSYGLTSAAAAGTEVELNSGHTNTHVECLYLRFTRANVGQSNAFTAECDAVAAAGRGSSGRPRTQTHDPTRTHRCLSVRVIKSPVGPLFQRNLIHTRDRSLYRLETLRCTHGCPPQPLIPRGARALRSSGSSLSHVSGDRAASTWSAIGALFSSSSSRLRSDAYISASSSSSSDESMLEPLPSAICLRVLDPKG